MKIKSITTKFIVLLSILMALVLAIQLYFNNQTQKDILLELNALKRTINTTTDQILVETFEGDEFNKHVIRDSLLWKSKAGKEKITKEAINKITVKDNGFTSVFNYQSQDDPGVWISNNGPPPLIDEEIGFNKVFKKSVDGNIEIIEFDLNKEQIDKDVKTIISRVKEFKKPMTVERDDDMLVFEFPNLVSSESPSKFRYNYSTTIFNEKLDEIQSRNFWITVLLFGLSIIAIAAVTAKFLQPIKSLNSSFDKVVQGNLDIVVESKSNDEIGGLSASFNHMVNELRKNKNKESLMQRQERLASLGQLAAGVAHEIKNPLNAINLTIEHLQDKFVKEKGSQANAYINTIQKEIHRLDKTVNNLLSYLRSENLNKRMTDVNLLLDEIFHLYEREIEAVKIKLIKEYSKTCNLKIDAERFKTVFMNIVLNAIQAMENGGELTVITDQINKVITVKDNGKGIPTKNLEHIFDLFYTTKSAGSGLGLPTAYKIIQEHGGNISIDSIEGKGTEVKISL